MKKGRKVNRSFFKCLAVVPVKIFLLAVELLAGQLLIQLGHVVIPFSLVAGAGHRGSQTVLLPKALDLELAATIT